MQPSTDGLVAQPITFLRRLVRPIVQLLRIGATPERLAWSIALGVVIGVNPLLGSTTLLALAVSSVFGLNLVATQLGNHLMYPFELLLFPVFIRLGIWIFHTPALPLERKALVHAVKFHPWETTRLLWRWEWHALVVWAAAALVVAPLLQQILRRMLERSLARMKHESAVEI